MPSIRAADLFDGRAWLGPTAIHHEHGLIVAVEPAPRPHPADADVVLPGLVDCGVNAQGYLEGPAHGMPFLPEDAFAVLCLAAGALTVVDLGNDLGPLGHLEQRAEDADGPRVVSSVARVADRPTRRCDRAVCPGRLESYLDLLQAAGGALVACGDVDEATLAALAARSWRRSLTVVLSRCLAGAAPGLLFATGPWPAIPGFPAYRDPLVDPGDAGTPAPGWFAPQLEASARWSIDGLMSAPDATRAQAFLPYARHFQKPRGVVGRRIGRDVLSRLYGDRDPDAVNYPAEGWAQQFTMAGRCLAASGSGSPGLVPGDSLWLELARLESVCGTQTALRCATGSTQGLTLGWSSGLVAVGRPADLLVLRGASRRSGIGELRASLRTVLVRGHPHDVDALEARVLALNRQCEEALL